MSGWGGSSASNNPSNGSSPRRHLVVEEAHCCCVLCTLCITPIGFGASSSSRGYIMMKPTVLFVLFLGAEYRHYCQAGSVPPQESSTHHRRPFSAVSVSVIILGLVYFAGLFPYPSVGKELVQERLLGAHCSRIFVRRRFIVILLEILFY